MTDRPTGFECCASDAAEFEAENGPDDDSVPVGLTKDPDSPPTVSATAWLCPRCGKAACDGYCGCDNWDGEEGDRGIR